MNVAGLFAGVGGLELGLVGAGHRTIALCEVDPAARAVLAARLPGSADHPDVRRLERLPPGTELVAAGFPCQDLSQAGRTKGLAGTQSSLVDHVFRLLDAGPVVPWIVLENVSFMLHLERGAALARLVGELERRRYRWAYRVVNTQAFLPQRRRRVFLVASLAADPAAVLFADDERPAVHPTRIDEQAHGFYWTEGTRGLGWARDGVPTLKPGSTLGIPSPPAILLPDGRVITPDIRDAERLQGFPADWTQPAEAVARPGRRWSLIGNAVSVPIAAWLGRRLSTPGGYDTARDQPLPADGRWPPAARGDGPGRRFAVAIGEFPAWEPRPPLHLFLQHPGTPLSAKATRGFLARADASTLRFVDGFKDRLRAHLRVMERSPRRAA